MRLPVLLFFSCLILFPIFINARLDPASNPIRLPSGSHLTELVNATYSWKTWHWGVETNVLRDWKVVPAGCVPFVKDYMVGGGWPQYHQDLNALVSSVAQYLISKKNTSIITQAVVFDLSDTLLSNLPYYQRPDVNFGGNQFNSANFQEYVQEGCRPAVPYMAKLLNAAVAGGFQAVVITGSSGKLSKVLQDNLKQAGYTARFSLILKNTAVPTKEFKIQKRKELVEGGYTIVANIGDQWRDITGPNEGSRTFKVPNPMYYLG